MTTNIRSAYLVGSGVLVDATTSVPVADTRIRAIYATGVGKFTVDGTSTTALATKVGNIFMFSISTASDHAMINFDGLGLRVAGQVSVAAPVSASTITVLYG